jgi:hypothetical protein
MDRMRSSSDRYSHTSSEAAARGVALYRTGRNSHHGGSVCDIVRSNRPCPDHSMVPYSDPWQNRCARSHEGSDAKLGLTRYYHLGRESDEVRQPGRMADRAVGVDVNMRAEHRPGLHRAVGADDAAFAHARTGQDHGRGMYQGRPSAPLLACPCDQPLPGRRICHTAHQVRVGVGTRHVETPQHRHAIYQRSPQPIVVVNKPNQVPGRHGLVPVLHHPCHVPSEPTGTNQQQLVQSPAPSWARRAGSRSF